MIAPTFKAHITKMAPLSQINLLCLVRSVKDDVIFV